VRITTNLVQLDAVVTKDDKLVTDLTAADFQIIEDGKPQTITNFSYIWNIAETPDSSEKPVASKKGIVVPSKPRAIRADDAHRTIAIVVDDLGISFESIGRVRAQLRNFVQQDMRPDDLIAIIRTGGEVGALQQFTTDKRLLLRAIDNLRWNHCGRAGISVIAPLGSANTVGLCSDMNYPLGGTTQALKFILGGMRTMSGRKSMVILSDNLPLDSPDNYLPSAVTPVLPTSDAAVTDRQPTDLQFGIETSFLNLAELAVRASVVIYGASTAGVQPIGRTAADNATVNLRPTGSQPFEILRSRARLLQDNQAGLDLLARTTGGFSIKNSNDFGLRRFARDQEGYYLLGYRPAEQTFDRRFHQIKVRVKRAGLKVRTRSGFLGLTDEETQPPKLTGADRINLALMSPFGASDIEVHLAALFANLPQQGSLIRSLLHFPADGLTFAEQADGSYESAFTLSCVVFGENGKVVQHVRESREIRLQNTALAQVRRDGLVYQLDVPLKDAGAYQFRVAVSNEDASKIGTAREFIDIPQLNGRLALSGITLSGDKASKTDAADNNLSKPIVRRFHSGEAILYGYVIYNATPEKLSRLPILTAQSRLFRDGKLVHTGEPRVIEVGNQNDLERITAGGSLQLGAALEPGDYILQVIVNDTLVKGRYSTATQWSDFQIIN